MPVRVDSATTEKLTALADALTTACIEESHNTGEWKNVDGIAVALSSVIRSGSNTHRFLDGALAKALATAMGQFCAETTQPDMAFEEVCQMAKNVRDHCIQNGVVGKPMGDRVTN